MWQTWVPIMIHLLFMAPIHSKSAIWLSKNSLTFTFRIPSLLGAIFILTLFITFVHVNVSKYKDKKNTPVLQINILPNPDQPTNQENNQPLFIINNQAYNNNLLRLSMFKIIFFTFTIIFLSFTAFKHSTLKFHIANYFHINVHFFDVFIMTHVRNFLFSMAFFFGPLSIILSSSELRPFFVKCLKCNQWKLLFFSRWK